MSKETILPPWTPKNNTTHTRFTICTHLTWMKYERLWINLCTTFNTKSAPMETITHTLTQTHTHTQICTNWKTLCPWFRIMFLYFQHNLSNIGASKNSNPTPNYKPNPSCCVYAHKQTPTLTKNAREIAWIQKAISDSRFHYNFFTDNTNDCTNFKNYTTYS